VEHPMKNRELIDLLKNEDPNALVIRWNDQAEATASHITRVDRVPLAKKGDDSFAIMIE